MPDIGATLREARTRQRLDISQFEAETKIRAKYLRALENEEWELLPGPAYVKSFLRTYADALGLDGKLLIAEYKLRHERLSDIELQPIRPPSVRDVRRRRRGRGPMRGLGVAALVIALLGAIYALGRDSDDRAATTVAPPRTQPTTTTTARPAASEREPRRQRPRLVRLRIVPTGNVYVCLKRAGGDTVVDGRILLAGSRQPTYRSRRFRLLLGNSEARLLVNGRVRNVTPTADVIGLDITRTRVRPLAAAQRPQCSA